MLEKSTTRWIHGAAFAAAILIAPCTFAQDYGHNSNGYGYHHAYANSGSTRHRHHHHLAMYASYRHDAMHSRRHHAEHYFAAAYRHESLSREATYESRTHRAQMIRASTLARERQDALEAQREEELGAADQRERPVTAELNLVQLRQGRERAAEMAQWQLQHGAGANG